MSHRDSKRKSKAETLRRRHMRAMKYGAELALTRSAHAR